LPDISFVETTGRICPGDTDEKITIQRDTNCFDPERSGSRSGRQRGMPQTRHQFGVLIQMEIEVRWPGSLGAETHEGTGGRERQAQMHVCRHGARECGAEGCH